MSGDSWVTCSLREVCAACCSLPRGNVKSSLEARLEARTLRPDDDMHVAGVENHIVAASIGQARRTVFRLLREELDEDVKTFKFAESPQACHAFHRKTKASRVLGAGELGGARSGARPLPVDQGGRTGELGGDRRRQHVRPRWGSREFRYAPC